MISYRQLEAFYWAAKLGTLAASAEKLCTTQSAITKRIQQLEQALDVVLYTRSGQRNTLTQNGKEVLAAAERMLAERDTLLQQFSAQQFKRKHLTLGVTEITAITWLPAWVERLKAHYPGIELEVVIGMTSELEHLLEQNKIQISVMQVREERNGLHAIPMGYLDLAWVGGPDKDGSRIYSREEIASLPIIRQSRQSALNQIYDDWLHPYAADKNVFTINNLTATASMVAAGQGISCLPQAYFSPMLAARKLVKLPTRKQHPRLLYAALFKDDGDIDFLKDVARIARSVCNFA